MRSCHTPPSEPAAGCHCHSELVWRGRTGPGGEGGRDRLTVLGTALATMTKSVRAGTDLPCGRQAVCWKRPAHVRDPTFTSKTEGAQSEGPCSTQVQARPRVP